MKRSVLIIESRDKICDLGSEGEFIRHMVDLMDVANEIKPAPSKDVFLDLLSSLGANIGVVHIATRGRLVKTQKEKQEKLTGFRTPDELDVTVKEIDEADIDLSGRLFSRQPASRAKAFKSNWVRALHSADKKPKVPQRSPYVPYLLRQALCA